MTDENSGSGRLGSFEDFGTAADGGEKNSAEQESPDANPGGDAGKSASAITENVDPLGDDFEVGDPVVDLVTGRAMLVGDRVADRADEYDAYDLLDNPGNEAVRAKPSDPVYDCVYVASVKSVPSKSYAFPSSRLGRVRYEEAPGFDRVYRMVARDVLDRLFQTAMDLEDHDDWILGDIAARTFDDDLVSEAGELAEAATLGGPADD